MPMMQLFWVGWLPAVLVLRLELGRRFSFEEKVKIRSVVVGGW
jgi:hypothetical protein